MNVSALYVAKDFGLQSVIIITLGGHGGWPNNSFNRSASSIAFIVNLSVLALNARPVNSGVRPTFRNSTK